MATIFQINNDINSVFDRYIYTSIEGDGHMIDTETGEIIPEQEVMKILDELSVSREEKLDSIAFKIIDDEKVIKGVAEEIKKLQNYKKSVEKRREGLIHILSLNREFKNHKDKLGRYSVTFRKSDVVNVLDEKVIPKEFLVEQPAKIDKVNIKKAIKSGQKVAGAELIDSISCSVK